jgi:transposase-like protein
MSTNKAQSSSKEQWWRRQVRQWRSSGLSVRAFCAAQGLSEPSFYAWRRTLAQREEATAAPLVPLTVTPESKPATADDRSVAALELVLHAGRRLRIGPGFDGPTLARLLALLEEGRP